jgi:hypothetical protein
MRRYKPVSLLEFEIVFFLLGYNIFEFFIRFNRTIMSTLEDILDADLRFHCDVKSGLPAAVSERAPMSVCSPHEENAWSLFDQVTRMGEVNIEYLLSLIIASKSSDVRARVRTDSESI